MSELKACPFCGSTKIDNGIYGDLPECLECGACAFIHKWNTRPIEDKLQADNASLTAENERLSQMLLDELSQLEIATDLGNKRWLALNDIYENGEKHNVDWCRRRAKGGLMNQKENDRGQY